MATPYERILEGIKAIALGSDKFGGWALSIIAGSVLTIISTSYIRPQDLRLRLFYLLYVPGWIFLGLSMYYNDRINRQKIAAIFAGEGKIDLVKEIGSAINADFYTQILCFRAGLASFVLWLMCFLTWWIATNFNPKTNKP